MAGAVTPSELRTSFSTFDVLIYSQLHNPMLAKRKLEVARMIWNATNVQGGACGGASNSNMIKCCVSDGESGSLEEAQAHAQDAGATFVVVVGSDH